MCHLYKIGRMREDWPSKLKRLGLWGKPKSEWPIWLVKEQLVQQTPQHIIEKAAYCDDDDKQWVKTVQMYLEWENGV